MKKIIALLALLPLLLAQPADAALTQNKVVTPQTPQREAAQFTHSSTPGTYVTVYTAGANGSKVTGLFLTTNDTAATHLVTCGIFNSATQYGSNSVTTVEPASGYNSIDFMSFANWPGLPLDQYGNHTLNLVSGDTIQCTFATTITTSDFVQVTAIGFDY